MNPDPHDGPQDYIRFGLSWNNHSFVNVNITNIHGEISVEGSTPGDRLPLVNPIDLSRRSHVLNPQHINVALGKHAMEQVTRLRNRETNRLMMRLVIQANVNDRAASFSFSHTAYLD